MIRLLRFIVVAMCIVVLTPGQRANANENLDLISKQTKVLRVEPIFVTLHLMNDEFQALPAAPGKSNVGELRFEIEPEVQSRNAAKPLPLEAQAQDAKIRDYDLLEWYQFPDEGEFTVRAVLQRDGVKLASKSIKLSIHNPGDNDVELPPVARLHHLPWSNYGVNKYCGDTFDLVNRWPDSQLAKYCHYWNGRFLQNNKEYAKAVQSYELVLKEGPNFALSDDADFGIVECLTALGKTEEARKHNLSILKKYDQKLGSTAALQIANRTKESLK